VHDRRNSYVPAAPLRALTVALAPVYLAGPGYVYSFMAAKAP